MASTKKCLYSQAAACEICQRSNLTRDPVNPNELLRWDTGTSTDYYCKVVATLMFYELLMRDSLWVNRISSLKIRGSSTVVVLVIRREGG